MDMAIGARPCILLVEDDAAVRRALQLALTGEGYDVRSYASGAGLERNPDALATACLVADLVMPEINAIQLLRNLREVGWDGKAILITGHSRAEWAQQAYDAGYASVISKPIAEKALALRIRALLQQD